MALSLEQFILFVIIATLAAIVYSLRMLVLMERRIQRIDKHIEKMAEKIVEEEIKIEKMVKDGKKKKKK